MLDLTKIVKWGTKIRVDLEGSCNLVKVPLRTKIVLLKIKYAMRHYKTLRGTFLSVTTQFFCSQTNFTSNWVSSNLYNLQLQFWLLIQWHYLYSAAISKSRYIFFCFFHPYRFLLSSVYPRPNWVWNKADRPCDVWDPRFPVCTKYSHMNCKTRV